MADVFISYSRLDKEFVGQLRDAFLDQEQDVWIDWESIPPSQAWWQEIQKGIAHANNFVIVLSPSSMASPICHLEISYARQLGKRVIPVLYADYERENAIAQIALRLAKPEQEATRMLWGERQPHDVYDANDSEIKHINYFFFRPEDDFATKFAQLMTIIQTDYAHKERHTTLEIRAAEWDRRGRDTSFLLLDTELEQAQRWLAASTGKEPAPTDLHHAYIQASAKRTRQLRNIRRVSIIGTIVAVVASIFAIGASLVGLEATQNANTASTRSANASTLAADANTAAGVAQQQVIDGEATLVKVNTEVAIAQATATQSATINEITSNFANTAMQQPGRGFSPLLQMNRLVEAYPDQALAWLSRGLILAAQGEYEAAVTDFDTAIALDPETIGAYSSRGNAYFDLGNYEAAIVDYGAAIALDPERAVFYNNRGNSYDELGEYEAALADFETAIALEPDYAEAYNGRGVTYDNQGEYKLAIESFSQAIEIAPEFVNAYNNRGNTHHNMGDYEAALASYNAAIQLDPSYATAYNGRGIVYNDLEEYEAALADFDRAIELDTTFSPPHLNKGVLYVRLGEFENALASFDAGLELDPTSVGGYRQRGLVHFELNNYDEAVADFTQVIALDPENELGYFNRGVVTMYGGLLGQLDVDNDQLRSDFETYIALGGELPASLRDILAEDYDIELP